MPDIATGISAGVGLLGSSMQADAAGDAASAQAASDAARLAEEKRVRELLRKDTEEQRKVADKAFSDYKSGLISYAEAQKTAANAMAKLQSSIGESQLSDTAKAMEMAKFQPYSIRTGAGSTFFDQATGQTGFTASPEVAGYQQNLFNLAGQQAGNINLATSPEQQAYQRAMYGGATQLAGNLPFEGTPEQRQFQQAMFSRAAEQAANLNLDPAAQAEKYYQQQQDILAGSRGAEDIAARQQALQRGRIGLGVSTEAAGAGAGGIVNPDDYSRQLAREQVNRQIAADASQRATGDITQQLAQTEGLFRSGSGAQDQINRALTNQLAASQTMAQGGVQSEADRQALIRGQLANATGLFAGGMAPEEFGINALTTGANIGNTMATQGYNLANLYRQGMGDVYGSQLAAGATRQEGALFDPQARLTADQEAYQRQQTYLAGLQGNTAQYQAMNTGAPIIPGSAYAKAGLGSSLTNMGMKGLDRYLNPAPINYTPTYGGPTRQISPQTQSNLNYWSGFGGGGMFDE